MKYPAIEPKQLTGSEPIIYGDKQISDVKSFWQWAYSDLIGNTERGAVAEYLVACALGIDKESRVSWGSYDLKIKNEIKIEIKTSGYLQTWEQDELSKINFNISEKLFWNHITNKFTEPKKRHANVYVFCVHKHTDQDTINPLDAGQWDFYVLPTHALNQEKTKSQKTISLSGLIELNAVKCEYENLSKEIEKCL